MDWTRDEDMKALLASIVDTSVDGIVGLRLDGTVQIWNQGAERMYGWTSEEMLDHPVKRIVPEHRSEEIDFLLEQVARGDVVRDLLTQRVRRDGTTIDISLSVSPIRAEDGTVIGIVKTERDVTRRRRRDAISDGQRKLLEVLTRTGRLRAGLSALLESIDTLTEGKSTLAVMRVDGERSLLRVESSQFSADILGAFERGIPIAPGAHPSGEAAFSCQAVSVRDFRDAVTWDARPLLEAGLRGCCSTPIVAPGGEVLGTLDLYGHQPGDPSPEDLEVVSALAQTAAVVMDRFRVLDELRTRRTVLAAMNKINAALAVELDRDRILEHVTQEGIRLLDAEGVAFFADPTPGGGPMSFRNVVVAGEVREAFDEMPHPQDTLLLRHAVESGAVQRFEDVTKDPRFGRTPPHHGRPPGHPPFRSFLAAPVQRRDGALLGMMLFGHSEAGRFARWHEELVAGIASQTALALDNAKLYHEARERAEAMAVADRRKDEFLAALGHELRNPLNAIRASLELLGDHLPGDERPRAVRDVLTRQVQQMGRLVDDLLDLGRITRGEIPVRLALTDIREPVRRAVEGARSYAARTNVDIRLEAAETPCFASADAARIEQVVGNLLHNAVKFSPDTEVSVEVDLDDRHVRIVVEDRGRGIAPGRLEEMFDLFTQLQGSETEGLGLGLTLVKQLVTLHGGEVVASSAGLGRGARFEVRLPRCEAPRAAAGDAPPAHADAPAPAPTPGKSLRILLAEDQEDAALAITMLMERWGHRPVRASSGTQALALAETEAFDVAVLDIGMPDIDGWEVAARLHEQRPGALRIAALSGRGHDTDKERSREVGIEHHFVKPVDPGSLRAWLEQHPA